MPRVKNNLLLKGLQGHIGKEIAIKQYGNKTVVSKYPDMSHIKPSKAQKAQRKHFAEACRLYPAH